MATPTPDFIGVMSSDDLWYAQEPTIVLTDVIDEKANINHTHNGYASSNHTHTEYASSDDLQVLEDVIATKADAVHSHDEYASTNHSHSNYATQISVDSLSEEIDAKADASHTHTEYASVSHTHSEYATQTSVNGKADVVHSHSEYALSSHEHDNYAMDDHNHNSDYAPLSHSHDNYATVTELTELTDTVSGKADSSHTHTGVYDVSGAAASALSSANSYTDNAVDALSETVATKANASALTSHTGSTAVHITNAERVDWNAAKTHADSAHAPSNAEPNQNAFSHIAVGSTTISADEKTDTLTLVAGNNVTITPNATGDSVTISSDNTVYSHPTSAGNKHIPAGGSSGQILRWASDGTAVWGNDNNTTYGVATETSNGLMSSTDKVKLNGIADGANNYTLPSAGTNLGGVKSGGDVTISSGVITVNDGSHNHIISNVDGLQSALDAKASTGHTHDDVYTKTETDTILEGKANSSHTHSISNITNLQTTLDGKAAVSHGTHVNYSTTAPVMDGTASVGAASTVARSDHKHPTDTSRASQADLNALETAVEGKANASHTHSIANVTNLQTTLDGKAASTHTHNYAGSSSAGGAATSANKLATARTISLAGDVTGSTSFDGSGNVSITATVADDSHNHTIANVDGLQTALDGKSATSHNHNSDYISKDLQMTSDAGDVSISFSGKDVVAQFKALGSGMYTAYSPAGCTNNPNSGESFRFMIHKTGTANYGWVMAYGAKGSVYTGYIDNGNWQGWKAIWEYAPAPLWSGGANGGYYMTAGHTITPTKKLSECRNGWALLWSDYDVGSQANNTDFYMSYIYKRAYTGQVWGGGQWYCDIPSYSAGTATDSEQRVIKLLNIYDAKIVGTENNAAAPRNDVVLRAVYEF